MGHAYIWIYVYMNTFDYLANYYSWGNKTEYYLVKDTLRCTDITMVTRLVGGAGD